MTQGHDKDQCYVLHPELFQDKKKKAKQEDKDQNKRGGIKGDRRKIEN